MPESRPSTTLFEDAIDVPLWLENDRATPYATRVHRDRTIAAALPERGTVERVRGWWRRVDRAGVESVGVRIARARGFANVAMFAIGAIGGAGVALTAFRYDGTRPINVVTLLATLVVAQLALLALSLLLIPRGIAGLRGIQDLLGTISPGAIAASLVRRIGRLPDELAAMFGWHAARGTAGARFARWQIVTWAQIAAVGFNLAALATGFALITFTDLAFGWSTTLSAEPADVARIVAAIAQPWHAIAPGAVPDLALVERSQFFRLDGARALDVEASRALAGWWSFTMLTITVYGLLPRIALFAIGAWRLHAATRALLLEDPRVTALVDRMNAPSVDTLATEPEHARAVSATPNEAPHQAFVGPTRAVIWADSIDAAQADAYARRLLGARLADIVRAGGNRTIAEDRAAIESLRPSADAVIVFTRAWEPPLLEFADFVHRLREHLGPDASIVVTPVGDASGVDATQRETWARAVGRVADPRVYLEAGGLETGAT